MKFLLTIIQAAGLGCASAAAGRRVLHYLQLESYQLPGYVKSVRRNAMRALIPPIAMAAVGVAALRLSGLTGLALLLEALTAALLVWQAAKEKAKKPFVATERVKRLLAVHVAVNTVLALALLTVSPVLGYLMPAFEPALLMLAALIAAPMEKHIAGQFVKDAQARLAAQPGLIKIGITGSYGKTSTKFLLCDILSCEIQRAGHAVELQYADGRDPRDPRAAHARTSGVHRRDGRAPCGRHSRIGGAGAPADGADYIRRAAASGYVRHDRARAGYQIRADRGAAEGRHGGFCAGRRHLRGAV